MLFEHFLDFLGIGGQIFNRSEILTKTTAVYGPELPFPIAFHCLIATDDEVYLTGGKRQDIQDNTSPPESSVFIWNKSNDSWRSGPHMIYARRSHACGSFTFNNSRFLVVTAGIGFDNYNITRTEFLKCK